MQLALSPEPGPAGSRLNALGLDLHKAARHLIRTLRLRLAQPAAELLEAGELPGKKEWPGEEGGREIRTRTMQYVHRRDGLRVTIRRWLLLFGYPRGQTGAELLLGMGKGSVTATQVRQPTQAGLAMAVAPTGTRPTDGRRL